MTSKITAPEQHEYAPFYDSYVQRVVGMDIFDVLQRQRDTFSALIASLKPERALYRYADGKWSVKQAIQHVIDAERIFAYRMLSFSRGETKELPGFDENGYAKVATAEGRSPEAMSAEFETVRSATIALAQSLPDDAWDKSGIASETPVTVRALLYIIAGHCAHHSAVLAERYDIT
jgi:uncharacterized damage-inducible protein DinB